MFGKTRYDLAFKAICVWTIGLEGSQMIENNSLETLSF
jgi:hypothetical protein